MPSLIKQRGHYYLQFYNSHRQPKQKRVALGTGNRRLAEQLQSRLMAGFLMGEYDPWGEPFSEITTLGEAFAAFMERKRNLRRATQANYRWIVGSFVRHAGSELPIESLTWRHIQRWLDSTDTNDQGRYSYWQRAGIFCRFLVSQGLLKSDLSKGLTVVRPPQRLSNKVISETDLHRIRVAAEQLGLDYLADVSLVTFDLALRLTEVCSMKKSWIDFDKARLTLRQDRDFVTKSGKELPAGTYEVSFDATGSMATRWGGERATCSTVNDVLGRQGGN